MRIYIFKCPDCEAGRRKISQETGRTISYIMEPYCTGCIDMMAIRLEDWLNGTATEAQNRITADVVEERTSPLEARGRTSSYFANNARGRALREELRKNATRTEMAAGTDDEWSDELKDLMLDVFRYVPKIRWHEKGGD